MRRVSPAARVGCAVFFCSLALAAALPDAWHTAVFCRVPACLAAGYFRADLDGAAFVLGSGRAVAITRECGGSDFFALVCAVLTWRALRQNGAARLPLAWLAAWAFTVSVNSLRVIATVWTRALAETLLPERCLGAVHMVSGVLVFFPALVLLWWACVRHDLSVQAERGAAHGSDR